MNMTSRIIFSNSKVAGLIPRESSKRVKYLRNFARRANFNNRNRRMTLMSLKDRKMAPIDPPELPNIKSKGTTEKKSIINHVCK